MSFKKTLCRIQINQFSSLGSVRMTWYSVWMLISQQHPSGRWELSVRTMRTFRPDAHQCLEASNSSRLHPFGRNGKSSGCSSKFEKILVFQWIRQDDVSYRSDAQLSKAPIIRTTCHTVQTHIRLKHHPSGRRGFPFGPSSMSRSFELLQLASVRTTLSVRSSFRISFRNTEMERLLQLSGRAHT